MLTTHCSCFTVLLTGGRLDDTGLIELGKLPKLRNIYSSNQDFSLIHFQLLDPSRFTVIYAEAFSLNLADFQAGVFQNLKTLGLRFLTSSAITNKKLGNLSLYMPQLEVLHLKEVRKSLKNRFRNVTFILS